MKILQVSNFFPPQPAKWPGGATQVAYRVSKELVKRGHSLEVWTSNALDLDMRTRVDVSSAIVDGIEVSYFPYIMLYRVPFFLSPALVKAARDRLNEFDVVHIHNYRTFGGAVVAYYAKKRGIPYLLQAHGSLPRMMSMRKSKHIYDVLYGYRLLKDASRVIAVTGVEVGQYKAMGVGKDKIEVIPSGIDLAEFHNLPVPGQFRKKYSLDDKAKLVLFLGRIHKIKGLDLLVRAFAKVVRELPDIKLAIVGPDDGYLPEVKKLVEELCIEEKVIFTGPLYGKEKLKAYIDTNVYVLPSIYEIFGLAAIEALACGTPIIVSEQCGLADFVDGKAGLVVPYEQDALGNAIVDILGDERKAQRFGEDGKLLVHEKFDWQKKAAKVEELYNRCIKKGQ